MTLSKSTYQCHIVAAYYYFSAMREVVLVPNRKWGGEGLLGCGVGYGLLHRIPPQPVNPDAMDTILKQNLPYDEQDAFKEPQRNGQLDQSALFVPADDENFEFGGTSGHPKSFEEEQEKPTTQEDFDETPVAHWHTVNSKSNQVPPVSNTVESHVHHKHDHAHDHDHGHHSHNHFHDHDANRSSSSHSVTESKSPDHSTRPHSHSPVIHAPQPSISRRTNSISSLKSNSATSPPPRSSTPTQSGVPTLSHTFSYRDNRNSLNGIVKPEPLRRLSSPPIGIPQNRPRMRGGIVHSPSNSISGTPTRVKSPVIQRQPDDRGDDEGSDGTNLHPASPGGSITSVD
jgi:hypothetical protein